MNTNFKVRDKRQTRRFFLDNEFIDGYAKYVGWQGQCVYMALVRHSKDNTCFPSHQHLAIELDSSISSIKKGLNLLEKYNIIRIIMRTGTKQGRGSNIYELQDYTVLKIDINIIKNWSNKSKAL